uniref:Uncharacterized protein n=2 Tax=Spongospora subterranea TaxID=70186 RepID=A0A0H5R431_9EUKA|eukprot:CRZ08898.1 hypothetical protein [Spongospora subterranea]
MSFFTRQRVNKLHPDSIWTVAWSRHGLITAGIDEKVNLWDPKVLMASDAVLPYMPIQVFPDHGLSVVSVAVSPNGDMASSSSMDGTVIVYNLAKLCKVHKIKTGPMHNWMVAMSDSLVATGGSAGKVSLFNFTTGQKHECPINISDNFIMAVTFDMPGKNLAVGGNKGEVGIFDVATGQVVQKLTGHSKGIRSIKYLPSDNHVLLTGSEDQTVGVFDVRGGQQTQSIAGHNNWVMDIACPRPGIVTDRFASCSSDKTVKIWELRQNGQAVHCFEGCHTEQITGIAFDPEGTRLVSVSDDAGIQFYDVPN